MLRKPCLLVALGLLAMLGCGGSSDSVKDDDSSSVRMFLDAYEDFCEPRLISRQFAAGKVPAKSELAKYAKYRLEVVGTPRVQGTTATAQVKLLDAKGNEVATKEWTLIKDGLAWKLENAPLP